MKKLRKKPRKKPKPAKKNPNLPTNRLVQIATDIVVSCGERDPKSTVAWAKGLPIDLKNGDKTFSNGIAFREILAQRYEAKFGERPPFGAISRALGDCNRRRFRKLEEN